jgi:hypothetical protein
MGSVGIAHTTTLNLRLARCDQIWVVDRLENTHHVQRAATAQ